MNHDDPQTDRSAPRVGAVAGRPVGMTLIELMVVLFIVAGIFGGGVYMMGNLTQSNLKEEAMRFASTTQYTYEQAALNNRQYRLVIDLDTGEYHTEVTDAEVIVDADSEAAEVAAEEGMLPDEVRRREAEERDQGDDDLFSDEAHDPFGVSQRTGYQQPEDRIVEPRQLDDQIEFEKVQIETRSRPIRDGRIAIHFFPNGMQQEAYVLLHDRASGAKFTLMTEPLTGRVKVHAGEEEIPEDFGEEEVDETF